MAVVYQKDKRSGITYAYESTAWWDKEKKQSRSKRTLIGRLDDATGKIVPTHGRCRQDKAMQKEDEDILKRGSVPCMETIHLYYGATYLLDSISMSIGITHDLKICFPNCYKQILSIAYYLILESNNPLYRFEKWGFMHNHPYGMDITSPRSSELFASIADEAVSQFFRLQSKRRIEKEYWAYDSTSISSYSETLNQVKYGKNKEDDRLAQLNLLLQNYEQSLDIYGYTISTEWNYKQDRPYKGDTIIDKRRIYIHLYYSIEKGAEDERNFDNKISIYYDELISGQKVENHKKWYKQFFEIKKTPKRGIQVKAKDDVIKEAKRYFGYFALTTNEKMDAFAALKIYRMKDVVEKAFGNIKERLNMRRLLVSSERNLDGKLFVEFVALILIAYINKKMQEQGIYKDYTMQQMLDKLDVIECFKFPGHELRVGEILKKQKELYVKLGVKPPASL